VGALGIALAVGLLGLLAGVRLGPGRPASAKLACPTMVGGADRTQLSQQGALAAAVQYATLLSRLFPQNRADAERTVADTASEGYRPTLVAAVDSQLVPLQRQAVRLPGQTVYRQSVLATRVDTYSAGRAGVSVWVLAVLGQAGQQANPMASFNTFTLALVWQRRAWRLDGTGQRSGPTPLTDRPPQSEADFDAALAGFTDWRPA
jgi:hypothetical protein